MVVNKSGLSKQVFSVPKFAIVIFSKDLITTACGELWKILFKV